MTRPGEFAVGRRRILTAAAGTAALAVTAPGAASAAGTVDPAGGAGHSDGRPPPLGRVRPDDPRYADLAGRGNIRFAGRPEQIYLAHSPDQVARAVTEAVSEGSRIAPRSGGHCFEGFTDDPAVSAVVDLSGMRAVAFDPARNAFVVEAGATMGEVYRRLFLGWGVTLPGGWHPVGVGGHIAGGGYGYLSRLHGLAADHLEAVEVVVVDRSGRARKVIASRAGDDPHRELWWAHTGGGGGNFGVATRFWFRTPGAVGRPGGLLPRPPGTVLSFAADWDWETLDRARFTRLVDNYGRWFERHSAPGSRFAGLYSELYLYRRTEGRIDLIGQIADGAATAEEQLTSFVRDLSAGVGEPRSVSSQPLPWLASALQGLGEDGKQWRTKVKGALVRRRLTGAQVATLFRHLTGPEDAVAFGAVGLNAYGGRINALPPSATAIAQRGSILALFFATTWDDAADDGRHLKWIREVYRDMFADTGGVPVPGPVADGTYINYPDVDLLDPAWNTSGVPWSALYYQHNYARLQRVKAKYDPLDVFRHQLGVRPPAGRGGA